MRPVKQYSDDIIPLQAIDDNDQSIDLTDYTKVDSLIYVKYRIKTKNNTGKWKKSTTITISSPTTGDMLWEVPYEILETKKGVWECEIHALKDLVYNTPLTKYEFIKGTSKATKMPLEDNDFFEIQINESAPVDV